MSLGDSWGVTEIERGEPFPCDGLCPSAEAALFRGVTVNAPAAKTFRWLCQLRAAPYSYDWLDNLGRAHPGAAGSWPSSSCATRRGPRAGPCAPCCPSATSS